MMAALERVPPPTSSAASSTVTCTPAFASATAAASPLGPLPTTTAVLMPSIIAWGAISSKTGHCEVSYGRTVMSERAPVMLGPDDGRRYDMGRIVAVFKADGTETAGGYSISEWWLEPHTTGPGPHSHPEDDVFYVIDGTMSVLVGDHWVDAHKGAFVLIPSGMTHDFENRSAARAGMLNFSHPGDFEQHMPGIVDWFIQQAHDG